MLLLYVVGASERVTRAVLRERGGARCCAVAVNHRLSAVFTRTPDAVLEVASAATRRYAACCALRRDMRGYVFERVQHCAPGCRCRAILATQ